MIGFLIMPIAVMLFMFLGYAILIGNFYIVMMLLVVYSFIGLGLLIMFPALWEFWFPHTAKTLIAHKRKPAWELVVDDLGYGELTPSKSYLPEGLVKWKYGWSLLPRPIQKFLHEKFKVKKKRGRKLENPEEERKRQQEWNKKQKDAKMLEDLERQLAEQISLKKINLKGMGKPLWLQYEGLAANFNPQVLVPLEANQDNPSSYFRQFQTYVETSENIPTATKEEIKEKIQELEKHVEKVRVVLDPRRFKEIHPKMYTQSQMAAHGRIHEEIGRLSVLGMPLGKILTVLLIGGVVIGGIFIVYFFFFRQPPPTA